MYLHINFFQRIKRWIQNKLSRPTFVYFQCDQTREKQSWGSNASDIRRTHSVFILYFVENRSIRVIQIRARYVSKV